MGPPEFRARISQGTRPLPREPSMVPGLVLLILGLACLLTLILFSAS